MAAEVSLKMMAERLNRAWKRRLSGRRSKLRIRDSRLRKQSSRRPACEMGDLAAGKGMGIDLRMLTDEAGYHAACRRVDVVPEDEERET